MSNLFCACCRKKKIPTNAIKMPPIRKIPTQQIEETQKHDNVLTVVTPEKITNDQKSASLHPYVLSVYTDKSVYTEGKLMENPSNAPNDITNKMMPQLIANPEYVSHSLLMNCKQHVSILDDDDFYMHTDQSPEKSSPNKKELVDLIKFKEEYEKKEKEMQSKKQEIQISIPEKENQAPNSSQNIIDDDMLNGCENVSIVEEERKNLPEQSITKMNSSKMLMPSLYDNKQSDRNLPPISYRSEASTNKLDDILKMFDKSQKTSTEMSPSQSPEDELHSLLSILSV